MNDEESTCNGCGYKGKMEATASATSWGRCPKCGTTNIEAKVKCDCGTEMVPSGYGNLMKCPSCSPSVQ